MFRPLVRLLAFGTTLLFASCSEGTTITGSPAVEPSFGHTLPGPRGSLRLIEGQLPATERSVSALIGPEGGELVLSTPDPLGIDRSHSLRVPAGAVNEETLFVMELASDTHIMVDLHAYRQNGRARTPDGRGNEVGHLGFQKPVILTLSYGFATNLPAPRRLTIVHVVGNAVNEKVPTRAFNGRFKKHVVGELQHFSRYAVAAE